MPAASAANVSLAGWQLGWWLSGDYPTATLPVPGTVAGALLADLGLIAAYGYWVARAVSWAFARVAGLCRAADRPAAALNLLGLSAFVLVAADLTENLLTLWLVCGFPSTLLPQAELLVGLAMSVASAAKWAGLAGCAALLVWGAAK